MLSHATLGEAMRRIVSQALADAPRFDPPPNLDLAVVVLPRAGAHAAWANLLVSREFPEGLLADLPDDAGPARGIRFLADARDARGESIAWAPGADWRTLPPEAFAPLAGDGPRRFIAPYPASLLKVMVAVGVAHLVDQGLALWDEPWPWPREGEAAAGPAGEPSVWAGWRHGAPSRLAPSASPQDAPSTAAPTEPPTAPHAAPHDAPHATPHAARSTAAAPASPPGPPTVADWMAPMIELSSNEATSAMVALLHARGLIRREGWRPGERDSGVERHNGLQALFARDGLPTMRLAATKPDGGWLNRDGAGVGQIQMTAWDTVRLLWRLCEPLPNAAATRPDPDAIAPPAPWLPAGSPPLLQADSRARFWRWMRGQALHQVLSSTLVAGEPGWVPGIPARMEDRWIRPDGSTRAGDETHPPDVRPAQAAAEVWFDHKTGTTASYVADGGRVIALDARGRRYLIACQATLGRRHAPSPALATDWALPRIGAAIDRWIRDHAR